VGEGGIGGSLAGVVISDRIPDHEDFDVPNHHMNFDSWPLVPWRPPLFLSPSLLLRSSQENSA
jgi:hypothetical protein